MNILQGASLEQIHWLQKHTLGDLYDIADELEYEGENVNGIRNVIEDLTMTANQLGIEVPDHIHDILEFVTPEKAKA